ncbi:MAG TPA: hypothetical protein VE954_09070 [Oligoflexus sp.]|uniref:hypothetical protein n=1 Tax=Oligoflexus sp. TaxID=1971216 RepID=UPI002D31B8E8|nr:hypothetical protein [Oligoflexus sp.]HYX33251.1 hypothetical protein [Oligoflexus sp.]
MIQMDFSKYKLEELIDLNRRLVDYVKAVQHAKDMQAIAKFDVGDRVQFKTSAGGIIKGTIFRINRKTVVVHSDDHHDWKVSPNLLQKVPHENGQNKKFSGRLFPV